MAKTKKEDNLKGFIDGKSHFTMEGKDVVKNSSAPDPERLAHDPVYAPVRANYNLFGSLSTVATAFRMAIKPVFDSAMDRRMNGSLTSFFRGMVSDGREIFNLRQHKNELCSYVFKKGYFFNDFAVFIPYTLHAAEGRSSVSLQLQPFVRIRVKNDKNHTHFRMQLAVMPFANSICTKTADSVTYLPIDNPVHGSLFVAESPYTDICELKEMQQITIPIPEAARDAQVSLVVFLHLAFYQEVNGAMYVLGNDVLKVAEVF